MIDDSCEVPREDLDDGFNPCRKQVVENGELCQYAHMYDVMNERYDREEDTSYLNSVKRDRISQSTPSQSTDGGKIYSQDTDGVEGFISTSGTLEPTTNAEIPSSKAVADYVAANIPNVSSLETEIDKKLDKVTIDSEYNQVYVKSTDGKQTMINVSDVGTCVTPTSERLITGKGISEYAQPKAKVKDGLGTVSGCNASGDALDRVMVSNMEMSTASDGSSTIPSTSAVNIALATKQDKLTLPLPVSLGGTGVNARSYIVPESSLGIIMTGNGETGDISNWTTVDALAGYVNSVKTQPEIAAAFAGHIADSVADNDLLPTNALMIDYVDAHSMDTPPDKFSFAVSPVPTGTWDGEMTINVVPVFATTIGSVTYVVARVYGSKIFNYTGSADNINIFSSLKPVEEYTNAINNSTNIPLTLSVRGRSSTPGTYGFTPNGSTANLSLNNQIVSSVFYSGDFGISNNLKCVFGEGTNTPAVTVSVNCMALMWYSPM